MQMTREQRRVVVAGTFLIAAGLLVAGVLVWRITSTTTFCPGVLCGIKADQHFQIYPHRAEALWVMSAVFGLSSLVLALAPRIGGQPPPVSTVVHDGP